MADGKWLEGLGAETPVHEAARSALAARLGAVGKLVPLAGQAAGEEVEYVHQLRVAIRRAAAAVQVFDELLPGNRVRQARRLFREVRQAAGTARDWDVFLLALADAKTAPGKAGQPSIDFMTGYALSRRLEAQAALAESIEEDAGELEDLCRELPRSIGEWGGRRWTLADLGAAMLPPLAAEFDTAVRSVTASSSADALHTTRIAGKRLRYAMEVFSRVYTPPFRESLYPEVERAQTILGAVQDASVAAERLTEMSAHLSKLPGETSERIGPGIAARLKEFQTAHRGERQAFQGWVKEWTRERSRQPFANFLVPAAGPATPPAGGTARQKATR